MASQLWQNRLPENRLKNDRWVQFVELLEEMWTNYIDPEMQRLAGIMTFSSIAEDRELRMKEWGTKFLATAQHIAPELGVEQAQALNMLKNTETLWRAYGRQLGFEEEDIVIETQYTENETEYSKGRWDAHGRFPTSRIALVLSIANARWYLQPVSSPANLLQEYAIQTKPAHVVLEPAVLQIPEDTVSVYTSNYSGYECERICRVSY